MSSFFMNPGAATFSPTPSSAFPAPRPNLSSAAAVGSSQQLQAGGSPIPQQFPVNREGPLKRPVVIDACNVGHTYAGPRRDYVSCVGILLTVRHFLTEGHQVQTFIPLHYRFHGYVHHRHVLDDLNSLEILGFTAVRRVEDDHTSMSVKAYDDLYVIQQAHKSGGVVVSNDAFTDVLQTNPEWTEVIENRKLQINFRRESGTSPYIFKSDAFGRRRPPTEVLTCEPGQADYPLVRHNQLTAERRELLLNKIGDLLRKIAENPENPPSPSQQRPLMKSRSPGPGEQRQPSTSRGLLGRGRGFTTLPDSAFLKLDGHSSSGTNRGFGFEFHGGFREHQRVERDQQRPETTAQEGAAGGGMWSGARQRGAFPDVSSPIGQFEARRDEQKPWIFQPSTKEDLKKTGIAAEDNQTESVVPGQDPFGPVHSYIDTVLSPALADIPSPATASPDPPTATATAMADLGTYVTGDAATPVEVAHGNKEEPQKVVPETKNLASQLKKEDFLSDDELILVTKLSEMFDPTLIRRVMKENPNTRAVMSLANLIYDNYGEEL